MLPEILNKSFQLEMEIIFEDQFAEAALPLLHARQDEIQPFAEDFPMPNPVPRLLERFQQIDARMWIAHQAVEPFEGSFKLRQDCIGTFDDALGRDGRFSHQHVAAFQHGPFGRAWHNLQVFLA